MSALKEKSITGFIWSFINTGGTQILGLMFGIILARILDPSDFGYIAIIVFFTSLSNVFVDSGFSHALIRDQNSKNIDYSSVFIFSFLVSLFFAALLYIFSQDIANYYDEPILADLAKVFAFSPIIHALMSIQSTIITKDLNFKLKAKLSLSAMTVASVIAIVLALNDYGIWSLLVMQLLNPFLLMVFLWIKIEWKPSLNFSINSLLKYMNFGIKLSISNFINVFYKGIYVVVIGKSYSAEQAGYFARADSLKNLPAVTLDKVIQRVSYPLLSKLQDDKDNLLLYNRKIIKFTALLIVPAMFGMAAVSDSLIVTLVGDKWLPAAEYLTYLCIVGVFYPFHSTNMNVIKVNGNMNLFLKLDLFKVVLLIPVLYIGVVVGIKEMLYGLIFHSFVVFLVSGSISGKILGDELKLYLKDILPSFIFSICMSSIVYFINNLLMFSYQTELLVGIVTGILIMLVFLELTKIKEYIEIKEYLLKKGDS